MKSNPARKFGRIRKVRRALLKSLASSLFIRGAITTTEAKAKEIRPMTEKIITLGKKGSISDRRLMISRLGSTKLVNKIFSEIAPKYKNRKGGYTRIVKLGNRKSDGAELARISLV